MTIIAHLRGGPADGRMIALPHSMSTVSLPVSPADAGDPPDEIHVGRIHYLRRDNGLRPASFSTRWRHDLDHHQIYDWDELPPAREWWVRYVLTEEPTPLRLDTIVHAMKNCALIETDAVGLRANVKDMVWQVRRHQFDSTYVLTVKVIAQ